MYFLPYNVTEMISYLRMNQLKLNHYRSSDVHAMMFIPVARRVKWYIAFVRKYVTLYSIYILYQDY